MIDIDEMLQAYLVAALWSSSDNADPETGGDPLDSNFDVDDIEQESVDKARADCAAFVEQAGALLDGHDSSQTGNDFWLTRCGHGAGFWDRGYGEVGDKLSDIARAFGNVDPMVDCDPVDGEWPEGARISFYG